MLGCRSGKMAELEQELATLRQLAAKIVGIKRTRAEGAQDGSLQQLTSLGLLQIFQVKDAAKRSCSRVEVAKEETAKSKLSLENSDSTLQNLLYEKSYYEKEIHTCRSFVSKVKEEAVALMDENEFVAALGSTPEDEAVRAMASEGPHARMKARLIHENLVRKTLVKQLEVLKQERNTSHESLGAQLKVLSDLQKQLRGLETTAKPLQAMLGPTVPLKNNMSRAAEVLPTPLYIAYSQVVATGEALQLGCSAGILGSTDEAEHFARSSAADAAATDEGHPNNNPIQPASLEDLYKPHPLSLELHVHRDACPSPTSAKPPTILLTVILQYLPALKVVTAHCKDPSDNALLKSLFPGDDGSGMPSEALAQLQAGSFRFSASRVARPYRWCQHLAGLDFVPTLPQLAVQLQPGEQVESVLTGLDAYRKQQRVAAVVTRLRQIKISDSSLNSQMAMVVRNFVPPIMTMYSGTPSSVVLVWEQASAAPAPPPDTPTPRHTRVTLPAPGAGAGQQAAGTGAAGPGGAAEEEGLLDDGELPQGGEQQQQQPANGQATGGAAAAAGGAEAPGAMDVDGELLLDPGRTSRATTVGPGAEGEDGEETEEGALPDEPPQLQLPGGSGSGPGPSRLSRPGHRRGDANSAALQLLLDEEEAVATAAAAARRPRPLSRLFRLVARSRLLELEASVRVFAEFPTRPPLFRVKALRHLPAAAGDALVAALSKGGVSGALKAAAALAAGEALGAAAANHVWWLEQQVNVEVLGLIPKGKTNETLIYQLTHLRLALDAVTKLHEAGVALVAPGAKAVPSVRDASDLAVLHARQQLSGRDRQPPAPGQAGRLGNVAKLLR